MSTKPYPHWGQRCWLNVWPGPPTQDGHTAPGHRALHLPLTPDTQQTRAIRTTVTQTIQGAYVDDFGLGAGQITLTGHTGWRQGTADYNGVPVDAYRAYEVLRYDILEYYFALQAAQATQPPNVTMFFSNDVSGDFLQVIPTSTPNPMTFMLSKSKPFLFQYSFSLIVVQNLRRPSAVSPIADPIAPLINVTPGQALSSFPGPSGAPTPSPVHHVTPPRSLTYIVRAGNTISGIATQFGAHNLLAAVQAIAAASHVANPNLIWVGQKLTIPQPLP